MSRQHSPQGEFYRGPPLRFVIAAVREEPPMEMPMATSDDSEEIRAEFDNIRKRMPHLHIKLYDAGTLIDEHSEAATRH